MYVPQGNGVTTLSGLFTVLRSNCVLTNSSAEIVRIDRTNSNILDRDKLHKSSDNGIQWIGGSNEYNYAGWSSSGTKMSVPFYRYSENRTPRICQLSLNGVCKPVPELEAPNYVHPIRQEILRATQERYSTEIVGVEAGDIILPQ